MVIMSLNKAIIINIRTANNFKPLIPKVCTSAQIRLKINGTFQVIYNNNKVALKLKVYSKSINTVSCYQSV